MKYFLLAILLFCPPALAGDITMTVNGVGETWTLSDADQQRFEDWVLDKYKCPSPLPSSAPLPDIAQPIPFPPRNCSKFLDLDGAKAAWITAILQGTLGNVVRNTKHVGDPVPINTQLIVPIKKTKIK